MAQRKVYVRQNGENQTKKVCRQEEGMYRRKREEMQEKKEEKGRKRKKSKKKEERKREEYITVSACMLVVAQALQLVPVNCLVGKLVINRLTMNSIWNANYIIPGRSGYIASCCSTLAEVRTITGV